MAIETITYYLPKYSLPLYTRIVFPKLNDYRVGDKYDIRIEDGERQKEKGGSGAFNYAHEAVLIAKEDYKFGDISDIVMAFDAHSKSREEATSRICTGDETWDDDKDVNLLVFLRLDKMKDWIESDAEVIYPPKAKEDAEGNGTNTSTGTQT